MDNLVPNHPSKKNRKFKNSVWILKLSQIKYCFDWDDVKKDFLLWKSQYWIDKSITKEQ